MRKLFILAVLLYTGAYAQQSTTEYTIKNQYGVETSKFTVEKNKRGPNQDLINSGKAL